MLSKIKNIIFLFSLFLCTQSPVISMEETEENLKQKISILENEIKKEKKEIESPTKPLTPKEMGEKRKEIRNMQSNLKKFKEQLAKDFRATFVEPLVETKQEQTEPQKNSEVLYKIGDVEVSEQFLREVATSIFQREQDIQGIKDKMCSHHGQKMYDTWKLGKQWGQLDEQTKQELKEIIKPKEAQSILKRHSFGLLDSKVIKKPEKFLDMVSTGNIELVKSPDRNTYSIKITKDFSPRIMGTSYTRKILKQEDGKPKEGVWHQVIKRDDNGSPIIKAEKSTRLYIAFDIDDIAKKIIEHGIDSWNPEIDGRISTICIDEK